MSATQAVHDDAVTAEIDLPVPPGRVFRALTDSQELFAWWGKEPSVVLESFALDPRPGGRWGFRCIPAPGASHGAVGEQLARHSASAFECHGEVLEFMPARFLVWSWIANWHEHPDRPTVVRWELTPAAGGTHLRVTHSGLAEEPIARQDYGPGWRGVLQLLRRHFS